MDATKYKFCINCKYYEVKGGHNGDEEYEVCNHNRNRKESINLVRGTTSVRYEALPEKLRRLRCPDVCGKDGKWFEQK